MKVAKSYIKQLVKEELAKVLKEHKYGVKTSPSGIEYKLIDMPDNSGRPFSGVVAVQIKNKEDSISTTYEIGSDLYKLIDQDSGNLDKIMQEKPWLFQKDNKIKPELAKGYKIWDFS